MKIRPIIIGERYGKLVITGSDGNIAICSCDCGGAKRTVKHNLFAGETLSCGCLQRERAKAANTTHGEASRTIQTPEYRAWHEMKRRCFDSSNQAFAKYGGRGISVCQEWLDSFDRFLADMGRRPSPKHSIDRRDVNGNYEPRNCRWATSKEQNRNRRNNRLIAFQGKIASLAEWSEITGIKSGTILFRLKAGWTISKALTEKAS